MTFLEIPPLPSRSAVNATHLMMNRSNDESLQYHFVRRKTRLVNATALCGTEEIMLGQSGAQWRAQSPATMMVLEIPPLLSQSTVNATHFLMNCE